MAGFSSGSTSIIGDFGDPVITAAAELDNMRQFVHGLISGTGGITSYLQQASADATAAIGTLGGLTFEVPDIVITPPALSWDIQLDISPDTVVPSDFGAISDWNELDTPALGSLPSVSTVTIPSFTSSIGALNIPDAPSLSNIPVPGDVPDTPAFTYPTAPSITLPDRPVLSNVVIPDFSGIDLPTLEDLQYPTLETLTLNTYINWSEPTYSPEIWADVKAQIERFFAGGSGIRPEIEEAMLARGRDREDRLVRQQELQATEEWAGRGYSAPPGLLVKRLDNIREEGLLKKLGLNREVVIKAMDEELANIRLAVQQGIVAEQLFVQMFLAAVERLFMVERFYVEWEIQRYNLLVETYKARFQENLIRAQIYEVRVRASLAEIEVFKALIAAEEAKTQVNLALVQTYTAEIQARESLVNIYKAQVEAVGVQAGVFETEVKAYGETVSAYAQRVNADKLKFDGYDSRIRGESAKAGIVQAEAQAYQARMSGLDTGVRAQVAVLEGHVSGFKAEVEAYDAQLRGRVAKGQTELQHLQGNVAGYQADTQRFIAQTSASEAQARLDMMGWETNNRLGLAWFETQMKQLELTIQTALHQKELLLTATKSSGDLATTITAGALAALNVGATVSGQAGVSGSGARNQSHQVSEDWSKSCSTSRSVDVSVQMNEDPGLDCLW